MAFLEWKCLFIQYLQTKQFVSFKAIHPQKTVQRLNCEDDSNSSASQKINLTFGMQQNFPEDLMVLFDFI